MLVLLTLSKHLDKQILAEIKPTAKEFNWKGRNENCVFLCERLGGKICGTNFFDCCKPSDCKTLFNIQVCVKPIQGYTCNIVKKAGSLFGELKDQLGEYDR